MMETVNSKVGEGARVLNYLYSGGYVSLVKATGVVTGAYIRDFQQDDDNNVYARMDVYSNKGKRSTLKAYLKDKKHILHLAEPVLGVVNTGITVSLLRRAPVRKYTRILNRQSLEINVLFNTLLSSLNKNILDSCLYLAKSNLFKDTTLHPDEALHLVNRGSNAASAFSSKFYFANSSYNKGVSIGYKDIIIGEYDQQRSVAVLDTNFSYLSESLGEYLNVEVL